MNLSPSVIHSHFRTIRGCPEHPWIPTLAQATKDTKISAEAFRLLTILCLLAHHESGRVLVSLQALSEIMGESEATTQKLLGMLQSRQFVEKGSKEPFLVLFVRFWPSIKPKKNPQMPIPTQQNRVANPPSTPPRSSALPAGQKIINTASAEQDRTETEQDRNGEGGPGGEDAKFLDRFVGELVQVVGRPTEREAYRTFCVGYPKEILQEALSRVKNTPRERIRKSPGALFTYLVKTLHAKHR